MKYLRKKTSQSRVENQQTLPTNSELNPQTNPGHIGGRCQCSHHCMNPAPAPSISVRLCMYREFSSCPCSLVLMGL